VSALALVLLLLGGDPQVKPSSPDPICCQTRDDLRAADGKRVTVEGIYRATRIEMKKQPGTPKVHAQVETPGGTLVLGVYYMAEGRRPAEELARLDGKKVRVVGTLNVKPPTQTSPDGIPMASMIEPCLSPVESVTEAR
jgi:hypothetical protein